MKHRKVSQGIVLLTVAVIVVLAATWHSHARARLHALRLIGKRGGTFEFVNKAENADSIPNDLDLGSARQQIAVIDLGGADVSPSDVILILDALREVKVLSLINTPVDDSVVPSILELENPTELHFEGSMVTSDGVVSTRRRFPQAHVFEFHVVP